VQEELDDDRALQQYREKRLRELKEKAARERFGDVSGPLAPDLNLNANVP
jgi:hypothetical protein